MAVLKSVVGTIGSVQGMPVNSVRMTLIAEHLARQLKSRPVFRIPTAYLRLHYKAFSMKQRNIFKELVGFLKIFNWNTVFSLGIKNRKLFTLHGQSLLG